MDPKNNGSMSEKLSEKGHGQNDHGLFLFPVKIINFVIKISS